MPNMDSERRSESKNGSQSAPPLRVLKSWVESRAPPCVAAAGYGKEFVDIASTLFISTTLLGYIGANIGYVRCLRGIIPVHCPGDKFWLEQALIINIY